MNKRCLYCKGVVDTYAGQCPGCGSRQFVIYNDPIPGRGFMLTASHNYSFYAVSTTTWPLDQSNPYSEYVQKMRKM